MDDSRHREPFLFRESSEGSEDTRTCCAFHELIPIGMWAMSGSTTSSPARTSRTAPSDLVEVLGERDVSL